MKDLKHLPVALRIQLEDVARRFTQYRNQCAVLRATLRLFFLALLYVPAAWFALRYEQGLPWCTAVFAVAGVAVYVRWGLLPRLRPLDAKELALYLDAHYPELQNRLITILEHPDPSGSAWIAERLIRETEGITVRLPLHQALPRLSLPKRFFSFAVLSGILLAAIYFVELGLPRPLPQDASLIPGTVKRMYEVQPGNVRVRTGANQMVWVSAPIDEAAGAVQWRPGGGSWTTAALTSSTAKDVQFFEFQQITLPIEYQMQAGRWQSEIYTISVWTPPEVEQIQLAYHYPQYLQMPIKEVPDGGDISAIEGTTVQLSVAVNKPLERVSLALDSGESVPLTAGENGEWVGALTLSKDDGYAVHLLDAEGNAEDYAPHYKIHVQEDKPPSIQIEFPRGDNEANPLEEVPFTFSVSDDFGLAAFGLQYEIAGRDEPLRIALNESPEDPLATLEEEHLLALEELQVSPGDFITWTVWAEDRKPDRADFESLGDPYFLEIRPFKRMYREALSNQGGGGGGNAEAADQKQLMIAIWQLRRNFKGMDEASFRTDADAIAEEQRKLAERAGGSLMGAGAKQMLLINEMLQHMERAAGALDRAALPDPSGALSEALEAAQNAHRLALRLQPDEAQVTQQQQGQGGGGGSTPPDVEALELARRKDFHEEQTTMEQQEAETDALLNKLKELARRQELMNEDIAKLLSELEQAKEDDEELRRKLEQLKEEQRRNIEQLDRMAGELATSSLENEQVRAGQEELDEARQSMAQSQRSLEAESLQQARSSGQRALNNLRDMEEQLRQMSQGAVQAQLERLEEAWSGIQKEQQAIDQAIEAVKEAEEAPGLDGLEEAEQKKDAMIAQREAQIEAMERFMEEAGEAAEHMDEAQPVAARKLNDWLRETSGAGLHEEMEKSAEMMRYGIWESAAAHEEQIAETLEAAGEKLAGLRQVVVEDEVDALEKALNQLEQIAAAAQAAAQEQQAGTPQEGQESGGEEQTPGTEPGSSPGAEQADGTPGAAQEGPETPQQGQGTSAGAQGSPGQEQVAPQSGDGAAPQEQASAQAGRGGSPASPAHSWGGPGGASGPMDQLRDFGAAGPWSGERMNDFMEQDAAQWSEMLRDANGLLPQDAAGREPLERAQAGLERLRNVHRRDRLAPRFDLFLQDTITPIAEAAAAISEELAKRRGELITLVQDNSKVPAQYQADVDRYFESLAELPLGVQEQP